MVRLKLRSMVDQSGSVFQFQFLNGSIKADGVFYR